MYRQKEGQAYLKRNQISSSSPHLLRTGMCMQASGRQTDTPVYAYHTHSPVPMIARAITSMSGMTTPNEGRLTVMTACHMQHTRLAGGSQ